VRILTNPINFKINNHINFRLHKPEIIKKQTFDPKLITDFG
jgi:hypothetical protein